MNNKDLYEKIIFSLLDGNQIFADNFRRTTFFEDAILDKSLNTETMFKREKYIFDLLTDNERINTHLVSELEEMFFNIGFKSAIKYMNSLNI